MKTSELTGAALDWAVAKCEEHAAFIRDGEVWSEDPEDPIAFDVWAYSTDWAQGGPIIEREKISTLRYGQWIASIPADSTGESSGFYGPTPLLAAMRCYVASKLGDEVEIPEELT